jgi:hypothetical protein
MYCHKRACAFEYKDAYSLEVGIRVTFCRM